MAGRRMVAMGNCPKYKDDITGDRFGRLVAISDVPKSEWKHVGYREYYCKCDCGKIVKICRSSLVTGKTHSCGCLQRERAAIAKTKYGDNLIGKKFGRLKVISAVPKSEWKKKNNSEYICECECGTIKRVQTTCLITGNTKSCGCLNKDNMKNQWEDISGMVFSELTAIRRAENHYSKSGNRITMWLFRCSCGKEVVLNVRNVKRGATKSCGHIGRSMAEYKMGKWLKSRNIPFDIETTFEDLINPYTGYNLYFDFKIYRKDESFFLIEHQGEQHFIERKDSPFGVNQRKYTDKIKKDYCKEKGITLYETLYNEDYISRLEDIIRKEIEQDGDAHEKEVMTG